ncbi:MAG TPA: hypothetical protein VGM60_01315 [Pseudonocardia sp.]|uniref:hypothetical protein n=1 Tax=Pseudonocardia sp. TaxID=60912 RepID=UPI002F425791
MSRPRCPRRSLTTVGLRRALLVAGLTVLVCAAELALPAASSWLAAAVALLVAVVARGGVAVLDPAVRDPAVPRWLLPVRLALPPCAREDWLAEVASVLDAERQPSARRSQALGFLRGLPATAATTWWSSRR